ncbi:MULTISPECIES: septum formation inhibitor Maf [Flavobacteriaceae]|uniref:septum formation inhibitor Maf n=1 Tax=Flavobacteriaceae TaxID=49546 RepID=UPI0014915E2C|nr:MULTISPECIES: septum formation inhibitor Maf [Allomuricauda]MDC6364469.1 septum formation inhibitor Maf [Muricauda sp. AC10]
MKNPTFKILAFACLVFTFVFTGCKEKSSTMGSKELAMNTSETPKPIEKKKKAKPLSEEFKAYWYAGNAEITSYKLEQARYGQIRDGHSVLIYVTEPFLPEKQVKADRNGRNNVSVLKLNTTKKYLTGIYPYSVMSSVFYPVHDNQHAIKTSFSMQEWCGHVYSQINNRDQFELTSHSYFESEADREFKMEKNLLEDEIWAKIRINPQDLPIGNLKIIPSLEYTRLRHKPIKAYDAITSLNSKNGLNSYTITYPELERALTINFSADFPHTIESWTEDFKSGFGPNAKIMTTKATRLKSLKTPYWGQNGNEDLILRDSLGL